VPYAPDPDRKKKNGKRKEKQRFISFSLCLFFTLALPSERKSQLSHYRAHEHLIAIRRAPYRSSPTSHSASVGTVKPSRKNQNSELLIEVLQCDAMRASLERPLT
jgi:hypothetical protein